ncbi:rcc01693 family protein [Parvibaculum sp.]|uniref:rcc01693 family protein n=1 Tax=Parvibaculum sp. TaxID=2024848 RepID=UPI0025E9FA32|nr:rcc01693 family protein [Parvibaculum sp.]
MSGSRFPWEEAMSLGLGTLRMPPEIFWRMTLPELAAAARAMRPDVRKAMGREEFDGLMIRYPDGAAR